MVRSNVFISYAHGDNENSDPAKRWLDRLVQQLKPLEFQDIFSIETDLDIDLGNDWHTKIQERLNRASAAVLLVSPDFLASTYIRNNELPVLLHGAKEKGLNIIPIILRPCSFTEARFRYPDPKEGPDEFKLSSLQAAGSPSKALNEMTEGEQDRALLHVAQTLLKYVEEHETKIGSTKEKSAHDIYESIPGVTAQIGNRVRLFGRDSLLATVSIALTEHDALLVYGMRGNGKTDFIQALGKLDPLCGKELIRLRASNHTTPEELFRQIAPLLGDSTEHPRIPEQLMHAKADDLSLFPNARPAWVWIDGAHQLLSSNTWQNHELERLICSLRRVLGQKWHWILELRERPPEGLMGNGCLECEIPGLDKTSLSACIAASAPQGQTEAWTYQGDNLRRLYQWLGGGHGEQAHPLTTHLLIEVARGLNQTPLQVRERHINFVVKKVEDSLLNDLFETVLSPPEQKLLLALALYRDSIPHDHADYLEQQLDTPGAWTGLDHRCLLASDARHERYFLHGFIAGWLRARLGYAGDSENDEADFDCDTPGSQRKLTLKLHSVIADCWLNQLAGSHRITNVNIGRALESFHHLLCAGDGDKVTSIAVAMLGGHEQWARQRLWVLCNQLHRSKAPAKTLRHVLEFIVQLDPSDHKAYRFLGESFVHEEGRTSIRALECFKNACELRSDFPPYWADLGNAAAELGGDEAKVFLERLDVAVKTNPNAENEVVTFARSQCLATLGQHDDASLVRMNQIRAGSRHPQTFAAEVGHCRHRKEFEKALELITLFKKRGCRDVEIRSLHAELLRDSGDDEAASKIRKECITEGTRYSATYVNEAMFLLSRKLPNDAIGVLERAQTLGLRDDHITVVLAKAYQVIGKGDDASSLRMQQITNGNSNPVLFSDEIKWLRDNKKTTEAIDLYLLAVERDAVNSHVIANHAKTLQIIGRGEEASRIRMEQIVQGTHDPAFYNDEAFWRLEQSLPEQARDLMKLAKERGAYDAYSDSVMSVVRKRLG
ncbi:MAG: TIR domain-containing protein [Thiobacillus sp.]|nr:TIR domain-containing protein [Thiobacillus sp.]